MISVDTKTKELIGGYANGGREWHPPGRADPDRRARFPDRAIGEFAKATPYGVYDLASDEGRVNVGDRADTAEFAVESIRRWWNTLSQDRFPDATRLLVTADAGGSNGYRPALGTVPRPARRGDRPRDHRVPNPPGGGKWNKIEHRLFALIA